MATEVALLPLRADLDEDFDLTISEAYQDTIKTLKEQHGFQRIYWGTEKQDPKMLRFFVDWNSVEDHIVFTKTKYAIPRSWHQTAHLSQALPSVHGQVWRGGRHESGQALSYARDTTSAFGVE